MILSQPPVIQQEFYPPPVTSSSESYVVFMAKLVATSYTVTLPPLNGQVFMSDPKIEVKMSEPAQSSNSFPLNFMAGLSFFGILVGTALSAWKPNSLVGLILPLGMAGVWATGKMARRH